MEKRNTKFGRNDLREKGIFSRSQYENNVGKCYEICHTFGNMLIDEGLPKGDAYEVRQVRVGEDGSEIHFIFILSGKYVTFTSDTKNVWIDLSLDQFNTKNRDNGDVSVIIPDANPVIIMLPSDERRDRYLSVTKYLQ